MMGQIQPYQGHGMTPELIADPLIDRFDLAYLIRKNFWKLLIAPILCAILGGAFYFKQEKLYESSALLMVDSSLDQLLQFESTQQGGGHLKESLKSLEVAVVADSVVLRVVNRLDLREAPGFLPPKLAKIPNLQDTEMLHFLRQKRIKASLQPETRLIRISVLDQQPDRARLIAEAFVEEFEGFLSDQRKGEAGDARETIEKQAEEARGSALAFEEKLKEFRSSNSNFPLEQDSELFATRLTQLGQDLNTAVRSRVELESLNTSVADIDPNQHPIDIIEIANYQGVAHVTSLLTALTDSKSRLAVAEERYTPSNPSFLAAKAEVDRNTELIREQARDIKSTLEAKYEAALKREELIQRELDTMQRELVDLKSRSSEFRALQAESENQWALYQSLQQRLSESIMSSELTGNIATVVSEPLTPFVDSRPPAVLFYIIGAVLGFVLSGIWVILKVLAGLPFTSSRQLEDRLGLPVVADWSSRSPNAPFTPSPALMQTINAQRSKTIQISAPGLNGSGHMIADFVAQSAASSGKKTLLIVIQPGAVAANIQSTHVNHLHRLVVSPENVMDESAFPDALERFRQIYDKIIIEAGATHDSATVNWISHFSDQDVVAVGEGLVNKGEIAASVKSLYRPGSAPVALILVNPRQLRKRGTVATHTSTQMPMAQSAPGRIG
ncbi:MAG: hypothetical protein AAGA96_07125 [Verrucomicrobiota bacterium]